MPYAPVQQYMFIWPLVSSQGHRYFACAVCTVQFRLHINEIQIFAVKKNELNMKQHL
jgi:hypothetical protein